MVVDDPHAVYLDGDGVNRLVGLLGCRAPPAETVVEIVGIAPRTALQTIALRSIGDIDEVVPLVGRRIRACLLAEHGRIGIHVVDIVQLATVPALDGERAYAVAFARIAFLGLGQLYRVIEVVGVDGEGQPVVDGVDGRI